MKMQPNDPTLVVKVASTLSLGLMASFLQALQSVNPHLEFRFSSGTLWSFLLTVLGSWLLWQLFAPAAAHANQPEAQSRRVRRAFLALCWGALGWMIFQFAASLKGLPQEVAHDITTGALFALAALGALGTLFWKITRGFEHPAD